MHIGGDAREPGPRPITESDVAPEGGDAGRRLGAGEQDKRAARS